MSEAIEDRIVDFLEEQFGAIEEEGHPFFGAELLDSPFAKMTKDYGVQVDDGDSDFAPTPGAEDIEEFDANVTLIVFSRVDGPDRSQRKAARSRAITLAKTVAKLFLLDPTMNERVNDSRVLRCLRGWANIKSVPYAIMNVPLIVNESGGGNQNG
jgi:hypothetical protein